MSITDITFLFWFLPLALAAYYIARDTAREYVLLAVSLLFYACGSLEYFALFTGSLVVTVALGRCMERAGERTHLRRILLIAGILGSVSILGYYKYADFAVSVWNGVTGAENPLRGAALPLGISFFTFKAISYLADIYRRRVRLTDSPVRDALYLSLFTQIQSGPLSRYGDMSGGGAGSPPGLTGFSQGVWRFMLGFCKKVLLANVLSNITTEVFAADPASVSTAYVWLGSVSYSLQLYFDFSGYSDMAIGLTRMFGYDCPENFDYPYMTESVSRFWRRWHITLGAWFRDYVYIPMGGSRVSSRGRVYLNLLVVWLLTGIWHGADWTFIVWGLGYFVLIALERAADLPGRFRTRIGRGLYRAFTLLFINFQWVIFRAGSLRQAFGLLRRMVVPYHEPLSASRTVFLLGDYGIFLAMAVLFCFPVAARIDEKLAARPAAHKTFRAAAAVLTAVLFIWAVSFVVAGRNNPFAYANF